MKYFLLIMSAVLTASLAGCAQPNKNPPASQSSFPQTVSTEASQPEEPQGMAVHSDDITMTVEFDKEQYDHNSVIGTAVSITNVSDRTIVYVKGSGSNIVPDAFQFTLDDLADLFHPMALTLDYRVEELKPGESLELQCDFVPYIPIDTTAPPSWFGEGIDYFKSEEFKPAEPGKVTGSARFTYYLPEEGSDENTMFQIEDLEERQVAMEDIQVTIVD